MATLTFKPRRWQKEFFDNIKRFNVLMVHRRAGKTVAAVMHMILQALQCKKSRPQFAYAAPEKDQGEKIVWGYLQEYLRDLPGIIFKESSKEVHFTHNKASISIIGLKNIEAIRGRYFDGIIIDEFSDAPADGWGTIMFPALMDRKGWAVIMGTPKGDDHFHAMYQNALIDTNEEWQAKRLTVYDTGIFSDIEIDQMQRQMTNAQFAQEMLCDSYADFSNKYYLELINRAEEQKRIGDFSYSLKLPVYTAWDLGRDGTAIWFAQRSGNDIIFIDYWEKTNCKLPEAMQVVLNKGYIYADHFLPHDSTRETIESESSTYNQIKDVVGRRPTRLAKIPRSEGIAMAQTSIIRCKFNLSLCEKGITALKNYQAKIDKKRQIMLDEPVHDRFSHGADAFRYMIQGLGVKKGPTYDLSKPLITSSYDPLLI